MKLFNGPLQNLEHSLDIRSQRHSVLTGNLANIDTPGFVASDVDFDASMASAMANDDAAEADADSGGGSSFSTGASAGDDGVEMMDAPSLHSTGLDGNTVDLDRTMAALAENGLQYGASAKVASKHLALLRTVLSDGNG